MITLEQILAEVEPVAWRWRWDDTAPWHYGPHRPRGMRFGDPDFIEPLFGAVALTAEREARERAEEVIRSSIAEMKLMAAEGDKEGGEHRKFYHGVASAIDTLEMRFARYASLAPSQLCCDPQGCGVRIESAERRAEVAEAVVNALAAREAEAGAVSNDDTLSLAIVRVLEADAEFRSNMSAGWEGDPLSDELDKLRAIFSAAAPSKQEGGDNA